MSWACRGDAVFGGLKFAGEMEADVGEVLLSHGQDVAAVGEENVASFAVYGHKLVLALLE